MLKHLELTNFRNYSKGDFDFAKTTIFIGPNGVGKTNIIEAIYLLSTGRSWRTSRDAELVKWGPPRVDSSGGETRVEAGNDFSKIMLTLSHEDIDNLEMIIELASAGRPVPKKTIKINGVKKKLVDFLGQIPTVLFSPEEINLLGGAPALRRRFLDIMLCQTDKKYLVALIDLAKILKSRNKLLYLIKIGNSKPDELEFWDEKLLTLGRFIIKKREKVLKNLNARLATIYQEIAGTSEMLELRYRPSVPEEMFAETLVAHREREIEATATLFGPHRDDFVALLDGKDITTFGSRGEFRSAVLSIKIAELEELNIEFGRMPVLLLDDIFSELDKNRRVRLAKLVERGQTVITTTDLDHIEKGLRESAKIVELN